MPYYRCPECGLTTYSVARYSTVGMCASCAAPLPFEARLQPAITHDRTQVRRAGERWSVMVREEDVAR